MHIKRFVRKTHDQIKEEIKDAFIEIFDSYDARINNSHKYTYNFCLKIIIGEFPKLDRIMIPSTSLPQIIDTLKTYHDSRINVLTIIKDSLSKMEDSIKSSIIECNDNSIDVHFRMYFT